MIQQSGQTTKRHGTRISELLLDRERSIAWLARKVDLSSPHLYRVLTGERPLTDEVASRIAAALGVEISELEEPDGR